MRKRNRNWAWSNRSLSNKGRNNILNWINHQSNTKNQSQEIKYNFKDEGNWTLSHPIETVEHENAS